MAGDGDVAHHANRHPHVEGDPHTAEPAEHRQRGALERGDQPERRRGGQRAESQASEQVCPQLHAVEHEHHRARDLHRSAPQQDCDRSPQYRPVVGESVSEKGRAGHQHARQQQAHEQPECRGDDGALAHRTAGTSVVARPPTLRHLGRNPRGQERNQPGERRKDRAGDRKSAQLRGPDVTDDRRVGQYIDRLGCEGQERRPGQAKEPTVGLVEERRSLDATGPGPRAGSRSQHDHPHADKRAIPDRICRV